MKKILILIAFSLSFHSSFASCLFSIKNVSDSTHIDSVYQSLLKMDFDVYINEELKLFLAALEYKKFTLGTHEEPAKRLSNIIIGYSSNLFINIYFDQLEYIPRYGYIIDSNWLLGDYIMYEKVSRIELVNTKIKPYPRFIKASK